MQPDDKVQMRSTGTHITMDGTFKLGTIFWTTPDKARHYLEHNIARLITGAREAKPFGPSETKPMEPSEVKKSLPEMTVGHSTASAPSGELGRGGQQLSRPAVPVSATSTPLKRSALTLPKRK